MRKNEGVNAVLRGPVLGWLQRETKGTENHILGGHIVRHALPSASKILVGNMGPSAEILVTHPPENMAFQKELSRVQSLVLLLAS